MPENNEYIMSIVGLIIWNIHSTMTVKYVVLSLYILTHFHLWKREEKKPLLWLYGPWNIFCLNGISFFILCIYCADIYNWSLSNKVSGNNSPNIRYSTVTKKKKIRISLSGRVKALGKVNTSTNLSRSGGKTFQNS